MNLYFLIFATITVQAKTKKRYCEVSGDDSTNQCFVKETLVTMTHSPHQLGYDNVSNVLHFSFDSGQGEYTPALYKIDTKELTVLKGVKDAFAIAYDPVSKEMYYGGTHGIYRFNTTSKSLKHLNVNNLDVWWLFVKKDIYFIKFPSLNTYSYQNGSIKSFPELTDNAVHQMVIDADNNKFFINNTGLYGIKVNEKKALLLRDNQRFLNMATDNDGYVYVCSEDGIYVVSKIIQRVKKVVNIHGVLGFTFDKSNNVIYSDSHEIVRLMPMSQAK